MFKYFYKRTPYIGIYYCKFNRCLISNNEYTSIPFFNYRILCIFNNTHNRWMCILLSIFKYESLEFSENMQYSVSIILFIFSYLYMLLMTDLFSKTEFTYMYFIKNSQIYVFMFTISVLVLLSVAIIVFSRIRSKLEIEM